jgi:hypothetical protein
VRRLDAAFFLSADPYSTALVNRPTYPAPAGSFSFTEPVRAAFVSPIRIAADRPG